MAPSRFTLVLISAALCCGCMAQEAPAPAIPALELPEEVIAKRDLFMALGLPEEKATLVAAVAEGEIDPMLVMMLMGGGGHMEGGRGMLMLSQMGGMGGNGGGTPSIMREGGRLFIMDDGSVYRINLEQMKLEEKRKLRPRTMGGGGGGGMGLLPYMIMGMRAGTRVAEQPVAVIEEPPVAVEMAAPAGARGVVLAIHQYAKRHDGVLPGRDWAQQIAPLAGGPDALRRPGHEGVGYALNEKLAGAHMAGMKDMAKTVLIFEADMDADSPVGGPGDVPEPVAEDGMLEVGFADGHVERMAPELLKKYLAAPVF